MNWLLVTDGKRACELAGRGYYACDCREYSDDESVVIMVDSNIREITSCQVKKAFAYKMKN